MHGAFRSPVVLLSLTMASASLCLLACNTNGTSAGKPAEGQPNPALAQAQTDAKKSLEELRAQVGKMREATSLLHGRLNALPDDMPDLETFRHKLFSVEEVFGVEDGRVKWLSGKLNAAVAAGSKEQLDEVAGTIRQAIEGNKGDIVVQLTHQLLNFEARVFKRQLPTGVEIKAANAGIEQHLIDFIEDGEKKVDKTSWFAFDRLTYAIGDSAPDFTASKNQIANVVAILKAYPQVKLKIGDFTENMPPPALNKKLSGERAEAVKKELVAGGIAAARLQAQGFGEKQPLCPANDTADCKMRNRRIAAQVTAK